MAEKVVIGNAELWHGDCREVLPLLPAHDLLCTDPPYGSGASAGTGKYGRLKIEAGTDLGWDNETPPQWLLLLLLEKAAHKVIFGGNYFALPPSRAYLVWDKGAGFKNRDFAECEFAWCSWDGNARVLTHDPLARGDFYLQFLIQCSQFRRALAHAFFQFVFGALALQRVAEDALQ